MLLQIIGVLILNRNHFNGQDPLFFFFFLLLLFNTVCFCFFYYFVPSLDTGLTILWSLVGFSSFTRQVYIISNCKHSFWTNLQSANIFYPPFFAISCTLPSAYSLQLLLQSSLKENHSREFFFLNFFYDI